MELDPAVSLAFTLEANPGSYALLLGAGVSHGAVPTAWEILESLVAQLAAVKGANEVDPMTWYLDEFGRPPNYSEVLEALSPSAAGRLGLLRPYFTRKQDGDAEVETPEPTEGHRAIARLMQMGFIKIVATTNFDHLLEAALEEVGVTPTVWHTPSAMTGGIPLHQQQACIIKIHGDYMYPSFLNTGEELAAYEPAVAKMIGRILDDYGLVTCGWSATWDAALRHLLEEHNPRRYTDYWIAPSQVSEEASELIKLRGSKVVTATSSQFFVELEQAVTSISQSRKVHPLSISVGVANTKRHISAGDRIALHDLIATSLSEAQGHVDGLALVTTRREWSESIQLIDSAMSMSVAYVTTAARWGDEGVDQLWVPRLVELGTKPPPSGSTDANNLTFYPETLLLYGAAVGMILGGRVRDLERILRLVVPSYRSNLPGPLCSELTALRSLSCLGSERSASQQVWNMISPIICEQLLVSDETARDAFDQVELLIALVAFDCSKDTNLHVEFLSFGIIRREGIMYGRVARPVRILNLKRSAGVHPWVTEGIFNGESERFEEILRIFEQRFGTH